MLCLFLYLPAPLRIVRRGPVCFDLLILCDLLCCACSCTFLPRCGLFAGVLPVLSLLLFLLLPLAECTSNEEKGTCVCVCVCVCVNSLSFYS